MSISSIANPANTSYVVISRESERFVNEIHDHKEELRFSTELPTTFQKSERREPDGEEKRSDSIKETCAPQGNKEIVRTLSNPIIDSSFKKTVIPTGEKKLIAVATNPGSSWASQSVLGAVFFTPLEPFGNNPSESTLHNLLETQSRCSIMNKITQNGGSRIAILPTEVICNHHR